MSTFIHRWHVVSATANSKVLAACDPAVQSRRDGDSLPEGVNMYDWCMRYVEAVLPHVAGFKLNPAYYQSEMGIKTLKSIVDFSRSEGRISLVDAKVSDIGSTNDAWFAGYAAIGFDAVTIAPYAGNIEGSIADAHARGLGAITMGFMSNPEFATEMSFTDGSATLMEVRIQRAVTAAADGIVIGATKNPNDPNLQQALSITKHSRTLYLVPGIGAQGGTVANLYASGIDQSRVILTAARSLMFPNGAHSSPEEQAAAAKALRIESQS
jgi:orotidine-5'-phosphate decarboxylase